MNRPIVKIVAEDGKSYPAGVTPLTPATFTYRDADCFFCEGSGLETFEWSDGWPDTRRCSECEGTGTAPATCAGCNRVEPLCDEGQCQRCEDRDNLPIAEFELRYGTGWLAAERAALRRRG